MPNIISPKLCSQACKHAWREIRREAGKFRAWQGDFTSPEEPIADAKKRSEIWLRRWHARRDMRAHRLFPMPEWPKERSGVGWCRWCGQEIITLGGKRKGRRSHNRTWHQHRFGDPRDCLHEWRLHTDPAVQFWHLTQRDGPGCALCPPGKGRWTGSVLWHDPRQETGLCSVRWSEQIEIDHVIPLWRSSEVGDPAQVRAMHGPDNLWLLCLEHHRGKSAMEAAQRAEIARKAPNGA